MSFGAVILVVLVMLVALAAASFFQNMVVALLVLLGLPLVVLLHALVGSFATMFTVAALVIVAALIHTITDTLDMVRSAKRPRRTPESVGRRSERSDRSRIAA